MLVQEQKSERRSAERVLREISAAITSISGEAFFQQLVRNLARTLHVHYAFITECLDHPTTRVRMLAFWAGDDFTDNIEYDLAGTPCDPVIAERRSVYFPDNVGKQFPCCAELNVESYLGIPIFDSSQSTVIGHMAFLDEHGLADNEMAQSICELFAARAGAELQRKHATEALQTTEARLRLMVEQVPAMLWTTDIDSRMTSVEGRALDAHGYCQDDCAGIGTADFFRTTDAGFAPLTAMAQALTGTPVSFDFEWEGHDYHAHVRPLRDQRYTIIGSIGVAVDVTARRAAEREARSRLDELAHMQRLRSMDEMASMLAHEINQPLCSILSYSQACLRMLDDGAGAELRQALERVAFNADRAGQIIRHLRGFVTKGTAKDEPRRSESGMNALVSEIVALAQCELTGKDVEIEMHLAEELRPVPVDTIQIQQVILNLLRNAAEAMCEAGSSPRRIRVETAPVNGREVRVSVIDSGPGLPAGIADRVFDTFVSTKAGGMGMGLSICRSIIEAHGGRINAEAGHCGGAAFHFTLPIATSGL